jgi:tetratricopeptide (TPR) repeat protein
MSLSLRMPTLPLLTRILVPMLALFALSGAARAEWGDEFKRAGDALKAKDYKTAEAAIIEAINFAADFPADDDRMLRSLSLLADVYRETRQWAAAAQQLEAVLEGYARRGINQSDEASNQYNKLGVVYTQMKDYDKALPAFETALAIKRKRYKQNAAGITIVVTNLGELYRRKKDWAKAEQLHLEAITDKELEFGPDHPTLIASLNDLALVFRDEKKLDEAIPHLTRAMELARKGTHEGAKVELATTMHNMAEIHAGKGQLDQALPLYTEALEIRRKELGADHPYVAETLNSYANLLIAMGKFEDALPQFDEAIRIRKSEFGAADGRTLGSMSNKAIALDRLNRKDEAEALRAEVKRLREKR